MFSGSLLIWFSFGESSCVSASGQSLSCESHWQSSGQPGSSTLNGLTLDRDQWSVAIIIDYFYFLLVFGLQNVWNDHHSLLNPNTISSNCLLCLTRNPKPKLILLIARKTGSLHMWEAETGEFQKWLESCYLCHFDSSADYLLSEML